MATEHPDFTDEILLLHLELIGTRDARRIAAALTPDERRQLQEAAEHGGQAAVLARLRGILGDTP